MKKRTKRKYAPMSKPTKAELYARLELMRENFAISEAECNKLSSEISALKMHLDAGADYASAIANGQRIRDDMQRQRHHYATIQQPLEDVLHRMQELRDELDNIIH